uniref:Uncharacterized protein n=1 Tax=Rhizophora mucronata TaxID=61149 RepID=A0A2P2Q5K1_RHIMU
MAPYSGLAHLLEPLLLLPTISLREGSVLPEQFPLLVAQLGNLHIKTSQTLIKQSQWVLPKSHVPLFY